MKYAIAESIGASLMFATLVLPVGCVAFPRGGDNLQPFVSAAGSYSMIRTGSAAPQPSGKCENCRGLGKIGDGRVFVVCPACKGSGKQCGPDGCPKR
jgi:hypothetical protein